MQTDQAMAKALEAASKEVPRGKYNLYTDKQCAELGKYGLDNGPSTAARHFSEVWGMNINESTDSLIQP